MNYVSNGVWVPAQDLIEVTPTGAAAVHGQMVGHFNGDIDATGAISLTTATEEYISHPIGLFYTDYAAGKVAKIGTVQSSTGTLYPPNIIVFSNVLSGLSADLMLVWATNGFEQNLVLKQTPPPPSSFGLSASTTTLQLWTAMDSCPTPQEVRPVTLDSGLQDHILIFGSTWFPVGGAFKSGTTPVASNGQAARVRVLEPGKPGVVPVAKSLVNIANQQVLIEEVRYLDLASTLSDLPQASLSNGGGQAVELANRESLLQEPGAGSKRAERPMQVASTEYRPSGVVLDYTELSGSASTYTFTNGSTYHIASSFTVGPGVAYFQQNACIKSDTNAYLLAYGNVSCSTSGSPTVFTSRDDNGYGTILANSTADPGYAAAEAIWMYYQTLQTTLQNLRIRWAQAGIRYDAGAANAPQLNSSALEDSVKGIFLNIGADTLYLSQDTECNVVTPIYNFKGNSFTSGTITINCGVATVAVSNNVWLFEPVWPAGGACIDTNDIYVGWYTGGTNYCGGSLFGFFPFGTGSEYAHFCADDYTWSAADSNYFYFHGAIVLVVGKIPDPMPISNWGKLHNESKMSSRTGTGELVPYTGPVQAPNSAHCRNCWIVDDNLCPRTGELCKYRSRWWCECSCLRVRRYNPAFWIPIHGRVASWRFSK